MTTTTPTTVIAPPTIRQLPKDVVDRIAAGEVVARPANALKELLENSLDAGSNKILIHVEINNNNSGKGKGRGGNNKTISFSISDNGCGISPSDLPLAAKRFATSKLTNVNDFQSLNSFGFRGEALASISMVSHLTITSRCSSAASKSSVAYECTYIDGKPQSSTSTGGNSNGIKRCARTPGTTVKVNDLFYNVPHRKRALGRDEYSKILQLLQPYAVQVASKGIGIIIQQQPPSGGGSNSKNKKTIIDLNTSNLSKVQAILRSKKQPPPKDNNNTPSTATSTAATEEGSNDNRNLMTQAQQEATKQVIATIYGSFLEPHLLYFQSQSTQDQQQQQQQPQQDEMSYKCEGFVTSTTLAATQQTLQIKQATLLVFVNERYVECPPLKRRLEEIYSTLTAWKKPPFIYLSIKVPANQVDVNVHPSKNRVALLYLEDLVAELGNKIQTLLSAQGQTFGEKQKAKITIPTNNGNGKKEAVVPVLENPYRKKKKTNNDNKEKEEEEETNDENNNNNQKKRKKPSSGCDQDQQQQSSKQRQQQQSRKRSSSSSYSSSSQSLVRTQNALPVGALEPFLVPQVKNTKQQQWSQPQQQQQQRGTTTTTTTLSPSMTSLVSQSTTTTSSSQSSPEDGVVKTPRNNNNTTNIIIHQPPCPFATTTPSSTDTTSVDMSQPGAFAFMSRQCTCRKDRMQQQVTRPTSSNNKILLPATKQNPRNVMIRPAAVIPTDCELKSIQQLRKRVRKRLDTDLQTKLRGSYFVGVVSEHRSLVQYQEELCMLNHTNLAEALFYQLALAKFGGNEIATVGGGGVDDDDEGSSSSPMHLEQLLQVQVLIEQILQMEEDIQDQNHGLMTDESQPQQEAGTQDEEEKAEDSSSSSSSSIKQGGRGAGGGAVRSKVNATNALLAKQATACLWDKADMLEEYFGIRFDKVQVSSSSGGGGVGGKKRKKKEVVVLTGLPILLEGHSPPPHGLPLFLLRLATEVDWEEEKPCFDSVCRELAGYYAQLPVRCGGGGGGDGTTNLLSLSLHEEEGGGGGSSSKEEEGGDEEMKAIVQHTLFPALSCLLMPSNRLNDDVKPLTLLSNLYKVFERC